MARKKTKTYAVGDVIREGATEPDEGTPLLDSSGRVEKYDGAEITGRWAEYLRWGGPYVVAPDYDQLVNDQT